MLDETTYYFTAFAIDQNNVVIDSQTATITTDFGWHVTPNTLFYIKNNGEITDHSQYNHAMQRYGTSAFATLSNGRKVLDLSGNNFTFSNQFTEANNKTQFTLHLRIKLKSGNPNEIVYGGWTGRNKSSTGTSDRWGARFQSDNAGNKSYILAGPNSTSWVNTETGGNLYTNIGTSEFVLLSATINGGTYKLYKNGSLVGTYSSSTIRGGSSTGPRFYLGGCVYPDGTLRLAGLLAYIGESDLEDKVQTDAEVLQFYNKTKKNYV